MTQMSTLLALLTAAAKSPGRKDLTCAPNVAAAITAHFPAAEPAPPWAAELAAVDALMGVGIVIDPDAEPGSYRLVRHYARPAGWSPGGSTCHVSAATGEVTHGLCWVIDQGTVEGT